MSNSIHIFKQTGSIERVPFTSSEPTQFLAISPMVVQTTYVDDDTTSNSMSGTALFAYMPVNGMTLDQAVDVSVSKTLNADFLLSAFGDSPVQIVLNGVNFYDVGGCTLPGENADAFLEKQVLAFYEKYKLSTNINNRIMLSIAPMGGVGNTFICALIKMKAAAPLVEKSGSVPAYKYNLTLIGVRA